MIRSISVSKYNAHIEPIFKQLELLKLMDILKLQELKFYYKYKNKRLPYYLQSLPFHYNSETHQHNTCIQQNIHVGRTAHEYAKKCIQYDLPMFVNNTPKEILDKIDTHSLRGFAGYIKRYYLSCYHDSCNIPHCYICSRI